MPKRVKRKRTPLQILRERERQRRLVPPVVINRRQSLRNQMEDPALAILGTAKRYSTKHANVLHDMMLRSMGLKQTPETVMNRFMREGLDDIRLDSQAVMLIDNAIRKISEILIFKMVATELVNEEELRTRMIDLFIDQRFDAMRPRLPDTNGNTPNTAQSRDPYSEERDKLVHLLQKMMGV